jgi:hypothetical protein
MNKIAKLKTSSWKQKSSIQTGKSTHGTWLSHQFTGASVYQETEKSLMILRYLSQWLLDDVFKTVRDKKTRK